MPAAMKMVRDAMGDDAVIVSTHTDKATKQVRITAAHEPEPFAPLPSAHKRAQLDAWLESLESTLRFHGMPVAIIRKLLASAQLPQIDSMLTLQKLAATASRSAIEVRLLAHILHDCFHFSDEPLVRPGAKLMMIGLPGVGKTLSIAKLATRCHVAGMQLAVVTCDTRRAGGVEQLAAFTDILGIPLEVVETAQDLSAIIYRLPAACLTLIDTAGCNPFVEQELAEMKSFVHLPDIEPLLAVSAGMDSEEAMDIARCFAFPTLRRILVTRADTARRFGSVLAAADASGLAFSHFSGSHKVTDELSALDATALAQMLLQHKHNKE